MKLGRPTSTCRAVPAGAATLLATAVLATTIANLTHTPTDQAGTVKMSASRFVPAETTITKGDRLRLVNRSGYGHTLAIATVPGRPTQPGAPSFGNQGLRHTGPGEQWTTPPWSTAGTYEITCTIHPHMNLTVHIVS